MADFTWGNAGEKLTPSDRRRRVAEAMILRGSQATPIQHWTQGAARVAESLLGPWESNKADATDKAGMASAAGDTALALTALGSSAAASPAAAATGVSQKVAYAPGGDSDPNPALDAIMKFESGGKNVHQNIVPAGGGFNPSTGTVTGPSSAQGYFQMITPTWRSAAKMAGIDTEQYPTAMTAPYEVQRKAAAALYAKEGFKPWAPYNAALRSHIAKNKLASNDADMPAADAAVAEAPVGSGGFAVPPAPVASVPGDDPVRLRQEAQAYAQTNPEAARQMLARADAAEAAAAPPAAPPMPVPRPQDLALAPPDTPAMTAQNFNAITGEKPLDPVFQSEGIAQPWMGTALPPQQPAQPLMAQAPLPLPRPTDLRADMPAPGAVPAIGQMPPPQMAPQPDFTTADNAGSRDFVVQQEQIRRGQAPAPQEAASPISRVAAAFTGGGQQAAPAAAPSPAVQAVAQAAGAPAAAAAPSPAVDRVAAAMRVLNSPYAAPGQRAIAQMVVQQAFRDPAKAEAERLDLELKRKSLAGDPLDRKSKELDIARKEREAGEIKPPPTLKVKQADGSEVTLEWDSKSGVYAPLKAPMGGAAVGPTSGNPYALPGKPTEDQSKSAGFANRMAEAHAILDPIEEIGTDKLQAGLNNLPLGLNNLAISKERQSYNQAKENFITAVLRKESGAVISPDEFNREERKYFPVPGEGPEQIAQKRQSRITALKSMMGSAGSGYKLPDGLNLGEKKPKEAKKDAPPPAAAPDRSALEAEARRRGLLK